MENAVEALKMAGSVLIFIIALSIAILFFSQSREAIDTLLKYTDREYATIEENNRFYYLANIDDTQRYVGIETIIPSIYRAYAESYKIVFNFPDEYYLYKDLSTDETEKKVCKIDAIDNTGVNSKNLDFLNGIVYHEYDSRRGNFGIENKRLLDNDKSLYDYITDKLKTHKIKETLGTYYMEDRTDADDNRLNIRYDYIEGKKTNPSEISDVNKRELRVITYTFEPI